MAARERLTINAGAALQLIDASSGCPIDDGNASITFVGAATQYTYTQSGAGLTKRYTQKGDGMHTCANLPAGSYQAKLTCKGYAEFSTPIEAISVPLAGAIAQAIVVCKLDPSQQSPSDTGLGNKLINRDRGRILYADMHGSQRRKERG